MMEQPDAIELRRRRRFLAGVSLLSGLFAAEGILIGVYVGDRLGYLIAAFFGVCTVLWASHLLTPPSVLLELPASRFRWIAPNGAGVQPRRSDMQPTEKPTLPMPEPIPSISGVWDRELDGTA